MTIAAFFGGGAPPPAGTILLVVGAVVALVSVPPLSALFSASGRAVAVRARLSGRDVPSDDDQCGARAAARAALRATMALNAVLIGVWAIAQHLPLAWDVLSAVTLVAIARDIAGETQARRRHPGLVVVWPIHRFDYVGPMLAALKGAGIDAHLRGAHHRLLFHFFAPYVAVDVLVPVAEGDRATTILTEINARLVRR